MTENPLLPNAELRALRSAIKRAQSPGNKRTNGLKIASAPSPRAGREALLAATLMQVLPGDILVQEPGDTAPLALLTRSETASQPSITTLHAPSPESHLSAAAGLAAAQKRAGTDKLVLTFAQPGIGSATWPDALTWAQTEDLPLILAVADPSGPDAFRPTRGSETHRNTLDWITLNKHARKLHLPILSVDGQDAVAVYRVMQESVLRARSGAGPAVLWAMLPTPEAFITPRPSHSSPLQRLERYMKTREISF